MSTVGDQPLDPVVLAAGDETGPDPTRWAVTLGPAGEPVRLVAPGSAGLAAGRTITDLVVLDAGFDVNDALASPAFEQVSSRTPVVVVRRGDVVGVWSGRSLGQALMQGPRRSVTGSTMPGPVQVPTIVRACKYADGSTSCTTPMTFVRRPPALPPCPNASGLTPHTFGW